MLNSVIRSTQHLIRCSFSSKSEIFLNVFPSIRDTFYEEHRDFIENIRHIYIWYLTSKWLTIRNTLLMFHINLHNNKYKLMLKKLKVY